MTSITGTPSMSVTLVSIPIPPSAIWVISILRVNSVDCSRASMIAEVTYITSVPLALYRLSFPFARISFNIPNTFAFVYADAAVSEWYPSVFFAACATLEKNSASVSGATCVCSNTREMFWIDAVAFVSSTSALSTRNEISLSCSTV